MEYKFAFIYDNRSLPARCERDLGSDRARSILELGCFGSSAIEAKRIELYFLPGFRESVGVKIGRSNFSPETVLQQGFDALPLKKRFTESLKALQDMDLERSS